MKFFSIAVVKIKTKRKAKFSNEKIKISKKTIAEVVEENGNLMAKCLIPNKLGINETFYIPFTKESLIPKNKKILFSKDINKKDRYICYYIPLVNRMIYQNSDIYKTLYSGLIITGYLVKINDILYFDYIDEVISFSKSMKGSLNY